MWPVRMAFQGNMDLQHMGRAFLSFFVKFIILVPACGLAGAVGFGCALLLGSQFLGVMTAALVLAIEAVCTIPATAWAFEKFSLKQRHATVRRGLFAHVSNLLEFFDLFRC